MSKKTNKPKPIFRRLRGYAFDPSLSLNNDTLLFNEIVYKIPWEDVEVGPIGSYIEIIDFDPTIPRNGKDKFGVYYKPIDLNDPYILAQDGFKPSDSNPQFHQQMVYAVSMKTIKNFEKALGRKIIWREREQFSYHDENGKYKLSTFREQYVAKLRIYPHALREPNAYYSPLKRALLFGYFRATPKDVQLHMPNSWVFTCLSHDIIAHEITHAILDGINKYYTEPTNPDVLAFHEAFADIVALFQHFTMPEVLASQISKTKGDLESQNILGQLAQEFGNAIGGYGSLRDAIGYFDKDTDQWKRIQPDPSEYTTILEPHKRGSILVAAVFDVFLSLYKRRVADLIRIATGGSGVLPKGEIHPDLVNRLAKEAAKTAKHILNMCIRAIDYCPPVDITFGEFLRGLITADCDLMDDDPLGYRLAFLESFKRRGIFPKGIKTLSVESVRYSEVDEEVNGRIINNIKSKLEMYSKEMKFVSERNEIYDKTKEFIAGFNTRGFHKELTDAGVKNDEIAKMLGIYMESDFAKFGINPAGGSRSKKNASFSVTNLREISRVGPTGKKLNQVLFTIIQTARLMKDEEGNFVKKENGRDDTFKFRGGTTIIFDLDEQKIKYSIKKPLVSLNPLTGKEDLDYIRLNIQYQYQFDKEMHGMSEIEKHFNLTRYSELKETFALLHNH